jgi:hypothetical protein
MLEAAALVTSTERMGYAMLMVSAIARGRMAVDVKSRRQVAHQSVS